MSQLNPTFTFSSIIETSERVAWRIKDIFPDDTRLCFDRPHLPEALVSLREVGCLSKPEKLLLNHIRGHSYMNLFAFVEEYIIAQTVRHAQAEMFGDHAAIRALLRFGEEELKHQRLFQLYCAAFERDFGSPCRVLGSAADVAAVVLNNSALAVMLTTLHLEIMTQQHFVDCIKDDTSLDPLFTKLLRNHWIEEAQHTKIDILEIDKLVDELNQPDIDQAFDQYFQLLQAFDGLLTQQVDMDIESLVVASGRQLSESEVLELRTAQVRSYRRDFLVMSMLNPAFRDLVHRLSTQACTRLDEVASQLSV